MASNSENISPALYERKSASNTKKRDLLTNNSLLGYYFWFKDVPAKYVSAGNAILLATLFPLGNRQEVFLGREKGNLLDAFR